MNTSQSRSFEFPRRSQHTSKLLQLPAEIRLTILRLLLLKSDGPLSTRGPHILCKPPGSTKWHTFSSQIFVTCQSVYHDAYHILYHENRATVRFCKDKFPFFSHDLEVLGAFGCFALSGNPRTAAVLFKTEPYTQRRYMDLGRRSLVEALEILSRFARIRIIFVDTDDYMIISRCLKRAVFNKHVSVSLGPQNSPVGSVEPFQLSRKPVHLVFPPSCFALWKCKSIEFLNACCLPYCNTRLTNLITDNTIHVRDLLPDIRRIDNAISILFDPSHHPVASRRLVEDNRMTLLHAVYNNDIVIFKQARRQLVEQAEQALANQLIIRKREIEQLADSELAEVDEEFPGEHDDNVPWRAIRIDRTVNRKDEQIANLEKHISGTRKLITGLLDEDDPLNEAETRDEHTSPARSQQTTSDSESARFDCSCGSCKIVNGRGVWRTATISGHVMGK